GGPANQNAFNLSGGVLDFQDTNGAGPGHHQGGNPSTITINSDGAFNFTGGTLKDVTNINTAGGVGTFTQAGGTFLIGQDEPDGQFTNNLARTTNINGGFSLAGGILKFDLFGPDATTKIYN